MTKAKKQKKAINHIEKAIRKARAKGVMEADISRTVDATLEEPAKSEKATKPKKAKSRK
jgi:hypothetical protein